MNEHTHYKKTMVAPPESTNRLLTTNQAAAHWGISRWTIYDLVRDGRLKPIIGLNSKWRWRANDLEDANIFQRL